MLAPFAAPSVDTKVIPMSMENRFRLKKKCWQHVRNFFMREKIPVTKNQALSIKLKQKINERWDSGRSPFTHCSRPLLYRAICKTFDMD